MYETRRVLCILYYFMRTVVIVQNGYNLCVHIILYRLLISHHMAVVSARLLPSVKVTGDAACRQRTSAKIDRETNGGAR